MPYWTKKKYAEYEERVKDFFEREGIHNLSTKNEDEEGYESYFSWRSCECCENTLGGDRYDCTGYNPESKKVYEYSVCPDCVWYAVYGRLDDESMMDIEGSEDEED